MSGCDELLNTINAREPPFVRNKKILVSIIVLNRNGIKHLQKLIPALIKHTSGIKYELIFVDNASNDNSVNYVKNYASEFPLQIIQNQTNESFSVANNKAVELAKGKYIVLLNNDIEPLAGWLNYLLESAESSKNIGSVGARLIYPSCKSYRFKTPLKKQFDYSCKVQHAGIAFGNEDYQFRPYNLGKGKSINDPEVLTSGYKSALTAACLLVPKVIYLQVGGLDESYVYGSEDVDFGLKLINAGYKNLYCADSVLFHQEFGTQAGEKKRIGAKRREENLKNFQSKWYLYIKKSYWYEKIYCKSNLYAEKPLTIAVIENQYSDFKKYIPSIEGFGWKLISITKKQSKRKNLYKDFDFIISADYAGNLVIKNNQLSESIDNHDWLENFRNVLIKHYLTPSIVIKIPAKKWNNAYTWGDYHMAILLKQQLENNGNYVLLQIYPEWDNVRGLECDVAIVMRGVSQYTVNPQQINVMWNISHPDDIPLKEYEKFDQVFMASELWANEISNKDSVAVEVMRQCKEVDHFRESNKEEKEEKHQRLLFVGNSRSVNRKILKDIIPTKHALNWSNKFVPNDKC